MSGPGPFPLSHSLVGGSIVRRLGQGSYTATQLGGIVTLRASGVSASGLSPKAYFVRIPTFTDPDRFALYVDETMPQLMNLVILSAEVHFQSMTIQTAVEVIDAETGEDGNPNSVAVQNMKVPAE